jgi:hypothetical protein
MARRARAPSEAAAEALAARTAARQLSIEKRCNGERAATSGGSGTATHERFHRWCAGPGRFKRHVTHDRAPRGSRRSNTSQVFWVASMMIARFGLAFLVGVATLFPFGCRSRSTSARHFLFATVGSLAAIFDASQRRTEDARGFVAPDVRRARRRPSVS